jgi:hypothetical protein
LATNKQLETFLHYQLELNEYLRRRVVTLEHEIEYILANIENRPRISKKIRTEALKRDDFQCKDCGDREKLQVHHLLSIEDGGTNKLDNLVTLCLPCHIKRHEGERIELAMRSQL